MLCPKCGARTAVLSTRHGITRRRQCANGHRFTTKEINDERFSRHLLYTQQLEILLQPFRQYILERVKNDPTAYPFLPRV